MKVKLISDVDGVVNIYSLQHTSSAKVGYKHVNPDGRVHLIPTTLHWNESVTAFMRQPEVELHWLTGWLDNAPETLDPLWELDSKSSIQWDKHLHEKDEISKKRALVSFLEVNPGPFIWVDDIATRTVTEEDFAGLFNLEDALVITTNDMTGVTQAHLTQMQAFVNKWKNVAHETI